MSFVSGLTTNLHHVSVLHNTLRTRYTVLLMYFNVDNYGSHLYCVELIPNTYLFLLQIMRTLKMSHLKRIFWRKWNRRQFWSVGVDFSAGAFVELSQSWKVPIWLAISSAFWRPRIYHRSPTAAISLWKHFLLQILWSLGGWLHLYVKSNVWLTSVFISKYLCQTLTCF